MKLDVIPSPTPVVPDMSESAARLKKLLLEDLRRSANVFRVDTGGCNACELEIFASVCPVWDAERIGIKLAATPRHADILLFTGTMTRAMREPSLRAYNAVPDPKIVMAYGPVVAPAGSFTTITGTGAALTSCSRWTSTSRAARQRRQEQSTLSRWRSAFSRRSYP